MSVTIIGRAEEKFELLDSYRSDTAEFIVCYGRRRIGKTFLIEELLREQGGAFFHLTGIKKGSRTQHLKLFSASLSETFYSNAPLSPPSDWMEALSQLTKAIQSTPVDKKTVIFMDEFPWICTKRSGLIQAVDYYWNRYWKRDPRIKFIICGSSASWIIRKIIHHKGGLHNRNTRTLLLQPFTLNEVKQLFYSRHIKLTERQLIEVVMFCGGIPYYLNYIKKGKSAAQMIDSLCFQENGPLISEFDKLFDSLFSEAKAYKEIIRIIASKREGMGRAEIESKTKLTSKGGSLSDKLKDLEDAAFIRAFIPIGHKRQGIYYRVIDEYCYFYLKWIEPAKHSLVTQERASNYWSAKVNTPEFYSWMGYAFESICYGHIREIRHALAIPSGSTVGAWRYTPKVSSEKIGAQVDLLFERADGITTLCEIKYSDKPFTITKSYAENLRNKIKIYQSQTRTKNQIHLTFITANGIKKNKYYDELVDNSVVLADFFKDL